MIRALLAWQTRAVLYRHWRVWRRTWHLGFLPPVLEPLLYFGVFGLGVGALVGAFATPHGTLAYADYLAAGVVAVSLLYQSFFEGLYGSYVRMFYQRTFDAQLATPVQMEHVVWGEILWAALKGLLSAFCVLLVLIALALAGQLSIHLWALAPIAFAGFLAGVAFGAGALLFTAKVPHIDFMNYPVFLIAVPLALLSDTYFPFSTLHPVAHALSQLNPVYHLTQIVRDTLTWGRWTTPDTLGLGVLGAYAVGLSAVALRWMHERVLGEPYRPRRTPAHMRAPAEVQSPRCWAESA
ncbi:MAG: ABC transporter permease [Bacteroidetes bacterium]|nr:ABC transporter permease [Bacteroidota bacterium]